MLVALFGDFISSERPIYCKISGNHYFPVVHEYLEDMGISKPYPFMATQDWSELALEKSLFPPIRFSPPSLFAGQRPYLPPGSAIKNNVSRTHWLGSDQIGRDVASGMVHGTRIALFVGVISVLLSLFIAFVVGCGAGYYGDRHFKISRWSVVAHLLVSGLVLFYAYYGGWSYWVLLCFFLLLIGVNVLLYALFSRGATRNMISIPIDSMVMRMIEVFRSVPAMFILLTIIGLLTQPSIWWVVLIIGLLRWPSMARLIRAETLKVRELDYIKSAELIGLSPMQITIRHIVPNILSPIVVMVAFAISGAILLEATLSFLGIGLNAEYISWGSLLSSARNYFPAWWLVIFPGLAIFSIVYAFNRIGDSINEGLK